MFPLRRRVTPRRGWHNEEWSRQWLQLLMGPRPPSVQWPRSRPRQPLKDQAKVSGRSSPTARFQFRSRQFPRHGPDLRNQISSCSEVGQVGGSLFGVGSRVSQGQVFKERHRQDSGVCGSWSSREAVGRVSAVHGRAAKRLEIAKQAVVAAVAEPFTRRVQCRFRKIGGVEEGGIGSDNSKPWFQSSAGKGTICDRTVQRRSERARLWQTPQF